jgi:hypothetical protein
MALHWRAVEDGVNASVIPNGLAERHALLFWLGTLFSTHSLQQFVVGTLNGRTTV